MLSRRALLGGLGAITALGGVGATRLAASDGHNDCLDLHDSADFSEMLRYLDAIEPRHEWELGERIPNPDPIYDPVHWVLLSPNGRRQADLTVANDDVDDPLVEETLWIGPDAYVLVRLLEPAVWRFTVSVDGNTGHHVVEDFDCNSRRALFHVDCEGDIKTGMNTMLAGCPTYPV